MEDPITDEYGFLEANPLSTLPEYYKAWDDFVGNLPLYNLEGTVAKQVEELPLLSTDNLTTLQEWKRAYAVLSLISHSYLAEKGSGNHRLPSQLAVPWWRTAERLGLPPVLTHAAVDLYNWEKIDPHGPFSLENIKVLFTMTGSGDEAWFYKIMIVIEYIGAKLIRLIRDKSKDFSSMAGLIREMTAVLKRMYEYNTPRYFFSVLRKYLNGWHEGEGLYYEGVDKITKLRGGSAAQSTLFQLLDKYLGVEHTGDRGFLVEMQLYMPEAHRKLLFETETIRGQLVEEDYPGYNECLSELRKFRATHMHQAKTYIKDQIEKDIVAKGTGGTDFMVMLKDLIIETSQAQKK